jgi:hypothetical protein
MTTSKTSKKAPPKPVVDKVLVASATPDTKIAAPTAPKPARRRAPAAAKVAPVKLEATVVDAPKPRRAPTKKSPPAVMPAVAQEAAQAVKPTKLKKPKLIRDSFTMPESEYAAIAALKKRCLDLGVAAKKSEVLRAAVAGLAKLNDAKVVAAIQSLAAIKTGRPTKTAK